MALKRNFEAFEAIFGEAEAEWEQGTSSSSATLHPFVFYVHALDSSRLEIVASDFHSLTWERIFTVDQLEDLRDDIGIGGSWSEFIDYLIASLSSQDVKLILGGPPNGKADSGVAYAKLIAHKSKGLPRVPITLNRLIDSAANDAMANVSLELLKAFKNRHDTVVKEKERSLRLKGILSSERERNESLQKQLDALSFLSKRKVPKSKASDKAIPVSDTLSNYDTTLVSEIQEPSAIPSAKDHQSVKVSQRAVPAYRRAKVRGASLHNTGDSDDN